MTLFTEVHPDTYLPLEGSQTMPRPKATADALERQAAADSKLGDLDEAGNERLPEFEAEHTNGHVPEGVRPSERCVAIAAEPSSLRGMRCTFREEHAGRHSWQPENLPTEADSTDNLHSSSAVSVGGEQPTLPGTPEPEQTEYSVPTEASFGKAKLTPAHGLKAIGDRLIADDDSLEHLQGVEIRYAWRRRGGTQGGSPRFARIKRPSDWEDYFTGGKVTFLVALSADHIREHRFTDRQIEAALHEQLCRTDVDPDDHDAFRILGPDFSGSVRTLDRFGAWKPELREAHAHMLRLPLEQAIEDSGADDGEESE